MRTERVRWSLGVAATADLSLQALAAQPAPGGKRAHERHVVSGVQRTQHKAGLCRGLLVLATATQERFLVRRRDRDETDELQIRGTGDQLCLALLHGSLRPPMVGAGPKSGADPL